MNGTSYSSYVDLGIVPMFVEYCWVERFQCGRQSGHSLGKTVPTGQHVIWLMNGTSYNGFADLGTVPTLWNTVGSGDFNADGNPDILWENSSTGQHVIWLMNGTEL